MVATTRERMSGNTDQAINARTHRGIQMSLAYYEKHIDEIDGRLAELEREWSVERILHTGASALTLTGIVGAITRGRHSLVAQGFFLEHTLEGWCPPTSLLRQIGIRTRQEIDEERHGLQKLQNHSAGEHSGNMGEDAQMQTQS